MEDAGCYERMFIFGRSLKRTPKCLNMNARVEDARRQLARLQQQSKSLQRGGGNRRRQAELQQALQRNGCSGAPRGGGGGLFDFFGGPREPEYQSPIYRSINPNGRYRTVCVRLCDGFYYPIHYSIYGSMVASDAEQCQQNCAAPAELYVYRNPGQEIQQAISLSGSAYMDLPVALKYRTEYVKGCSCKQSEYNPTEIEAANKKQAAAEFWRQGSSGQGRRGACTPGKASAWRNAATRSRYHRQRRTGPGRAGATGCGSRGGCQPSAPCPDDRGTCSAGPRPVHHHQEAARSRELAAHFLLTPSCLQAAPARGRGRSAAGDA